MAEDKFIVTSLKDSKKINRVLANDTAREIMELLAEKRMTAAEIAERMNLPLTTVDYSLKNLQAVGLVKTKSGFNKNTRVVKYYEPQEKFIVIAPKQTTNTLSLLKALIPALLLLAVSFSFFYSQKETQDYGPEQAAGIRETYDNSLRTEQENTANTIPTGYDAGTPYVPNSPAEAAIPAAMQTNTTNETVRN